MTDKDQHSEKDEQVARLGYEIMRHGPEAVLPHNLTDEWLHILAVEFNGLESGKAPGCLVIIVTNLMSLTKPNLDMEKHTNEIYRAIQCYGLSVIIEGLYRQGHLKSRSIATVADILDGDAQRNLQFPPELIEMIKSQRQHGQVTIN